MGSNLKSKYDIDISDERDLYDINSTNNLIYRKYKFHFLQLKRITYYINQYYVDNFLDQIILRDDGWLLDQTDKILFMITDSLIACDQLLKKGNLVSAICVMSMVHEYILKYTLIELNDNELNNKYHNWARFKGIQVNKENI